MNVKAQGALEYLIIIAAVLAVAAIVVTIVTGVLEGRDAEMLTTEAQEAASSCYSALVANNEPTGNNANITDGGPSENICEEICTGEWEGHPEVGVVSGQNASGTDITEPKQACLAGEPGWIIQVEQ